MYNDELDMILESAYEDGYYQALADMGYEFDDEAIEDVDIFDEDCFDDAMEGRAVYKDGEPVNNKARKRDAMTAYGHELHNRGLGSITNKPVDNATALGLARVTSKSESAVDRNKNRRRPEAQKRRNEMLNSVYLQPSNRNRLSQN